MLILGHHRINPEARDGLSVSNADFETQLKHLLKNGYECVSLEEAFRSGQPLNKGKRFAITIDDGYKDNYLHAFPILKKLGVKATLFVATYYLDTGALFPWVRPEDYTEMLPEDYPMTWDELDEMVEDGCVEVGSHTMTHPMLSTLESGAAYTEIRDSKEILEDRYSKEMPMFCYPAGNFNDETVQLVEKAGYTAAVVSPDKYLEDTPFTLRRVGLDRGTTPLLFQVKISSFWEALERSPFGWGARRMLRSSYRMVRR